MLSPCTSLSIGLTIVPLTIIAFVVAATRLVPHPFSFRAPDEYTIHAEISMAIELISADPIARTFTTEWYPLIPFERCNSTIGKVVNIFLDPGILDSSSAGFDILPNIRPVHQFNITAVCEGRSTAFPAFRTVTKILNSGEERGFPGSSSSSIQNYPFDAYFVPMYFRGLDADTGERVALNITRSFGGVMNFVIDLQSSGQYALEEWVYYHLILRRSKATRIFVVVAGITNWLTALAFLTICVATVIYPAHEIYAEIFVVPVGAVFAFTAIRAGFPGAPSGFGATIDIYTILPALIIMSLCSFFLPLVILYRRIRVFDHRLTAKEDSKTPSRWLVFVCERLMERWFPC